MPLSDHDVRVMAAAARTLPERLQGCAPPDDQQIQETIPAALDGLVPTLHAGGLAPLSAASGL